MEDFTRMKVIEEATERTAVVERITKKVDETSKRFLDMLANMTDQQIQFTQERQIEAQQHKQQLHLRLQACETRSPSRVEGQRRGQTHESQYSCRAAPTDHRSDSDQDEATERHVDSRDYHGQEMRLLESADPTHPRLHDDQGKAESSRLYEIRMAQQMAKFEQKSKVPNSEYPRFRSEEMEAGARTPQTRFKAPMHQRGASNPQALRLGQEQLTQKTLTEAQYVLSEGQYQGAAGSRAQSEKSNDPEIDFE